MQKQIYSAIAKEIENNSTSWLVTVVYASGSTPGRVGMKMIIKANSEIVGTVGGGAIETQVIKKTLAEKPNKPVRWNFELGKNSRGEKTGMVCGGSQEVLVDPLFSGHHLYIVGGGHCGQALSELASKCGFYVTVVDDRKECANPISHPNAAKVICAPYSEIDKHINFSPEIFIVIMTHGHFKDEAVVRKILRKNYKYLGMIGSVNKTKELFSRLQKSGFKRKELQKIFSPIGFKIGTQTPYEIAVGIVAQLLAVKSDITSFEFNSNPW